MPYAKQDLDYKIHDIALKWKGNYERSNIHIICKAKQSYQVKTHRQTDR